MHGKCAAKRLHRELEVRMTNSCKPECKELGATVLAPAPAPWGAFFTLLASIKNTVKRSA